MVIRCTAKLLKLIGGGAPTDAAPADDDWYANLIWIERRKCLLLVHAGTLFAVLVPDVRKRDLVELGAVAKREVTAALADAALPTNQLGDLDQGSVQICKTASRQVLGYMTDMAFAAERAASVDGGLRTLDLSRLHDRLHRTLLNRGGYVVPIELTRAWHER